jgi:hypothetical protein
MATNKKQSKVAKKTVKKTSQAKKPAANKAPQKHAPKKPDQKKKVTKPAPSSGGAKETAAPSSFALNHVLQRQHEVAWRLIDGEAVVITPVDSTMHSLNDTGTRIWEAIDGQRSLKEVAQLLATEFAVDRDRAQKDTLWFVECLAKKGLVDKV